MSYAREGARAPPQPHKSIVAYAPAYAVHSVACAPDFGWEHGTGLRAYARLARPARGAYFAALVTEGPRGPEGPWRADSALGARLAYARLTRGLRGFPASVRGAGAQKRGILINPIQT